MANVEGMSAGNHTAVHHRLCVWNYIGADRSPDASVKQQNSKQNSGVLCLGYSRHAITCSIVYHLYGLPTIGIVMTPFVSAAVGLTISQGAYPKSSGRRYGCSQGQWEAASALSLTKVQTLRHIVIPQAALIAVPSVGNYFISLTKDTSLCGIDRTGDVPGSPPDGRHELPAPLDVPGSRINLPGYLYNINIATWVSWKER